MFQDKSQVVALSFKTFLPLKVSEAKLWTQTFLAHLDPNTGVVFCLFFHLWLKGLPRAPQDMRRAEGWPGAAQFQPCWDLCSRLGAPKSTLRLHTKFFVQRFKGFPCFVKGISSSKRQQVGEIDILIKPDSSIIYHSSSLPFCHCFTAWPRMSTLTALFWRFVLCLQVRPTASQTVFPWNLEAWRLSSLADPTPRNSGCILSSWDTNWFNVARGLVYLNYL